MTQERTYPRKWYSVSRWGDEVHEREFIRETDKQLVYHDFRRREKRELKQSKYCAWYPTREEAEAILAAKLARKAEQKTRRLKQGAAEELYDALEALVAECDRGQRPGGGSIVPPAARAALSKARGEQS